MEDPEQQDSVESEVRDSGSAATNSGRQSFGHPLLRHIDPLGPVRAQIASLSRVRGQSGVYALTRDSAVTGAMGAAAAAKAQLGILNSAGITGQSVLSNSVVGAMMADTAWQRSLGGSVLSSFAAAKPQLAFLNSNAAWITGPAFWSKGVLNIVATGTAWQNSVLNSVRVATVKPQLGILSSVRQVENHWASSYISPFGAMPQWTASFPSSLHQIAGQIGRVFTQDLLSRFDGLRGLFREWLPDNLRDIDAGRWLWLLRICAKEGTCLAWAPRVEIVADLLDMRSSADRRRYLIEHRLEVVEDVESSLKEVDHPELLDHREFTLQAAACIRDGHDAAAQALLANVLDTVMRDHGHAWLRSYFPQATFTGTGSNKMIAGAHGTHTGGAELRMLAPYLLVNALKNVFLNNVDRQNTLNRHLGAHHASADTYRSVFAFAALLNTQALLRLIDRYLYA
ncbi:hypothetical protein [Streptomyces sp900105755]|uniref:Uncharacterized protein n=1 Tax=Streptomyces sp. 900105755 TaxID=3154389 RepID=A0ABV1TY45_9ACTN